MRRSDRRPESLRESMNFKEGYYPEDVLRQSRATGGALRSTKADGGDVEKRTSAKRGCRITGVSGKSDLYSGERKKKAPRGSTLSGDMRHRQAVKKGGDVKRERKFSGGDILSTGLSMLPFLLAEGGQAKMDPSAMKRGGEAKRKKRMSGGDMLGMGLSMLPMFLKDGGKAKRRSYHEMGDMVATDGSPTAMKRGGHPKERQKHAAGAVAKIRKGEY